jgi:HNH endonuclease
MSKIDWLSEWLSYDSVSGHLTWLQKPAKNVAAGAVAGCRNPAGYVRVKVCKKWFTAHRVAWFLHYGEAPEGDIDHIDGNPSNNAITNLRCVSHQDNLRNTKKRKDNTSGVTGVFMDASRGKLVSSIYVSGKNRHLYIGDDFFEAVCRRKSAECGLGFHFNHGRAA